MLANFPWGDFLRYPRTISKFSKRKGESSSCVYVIHKRDMLGNLTWKSRDIVADFLILWIETSMVVKVLRKTQKTFDLRYLL